MSPREGNGQVRGWELGWGSPASLWPRRVMIIGQSDRGSCQRCVGNRPSVSTGLGLFHLTDTSPPVLGKPGVGTVLPAM